MPIPLGFFATAGAAAGATGAFEQISTSILGTDTATINFSAIPQTYKHLQIRGAVRGWTNTHSTIALRFNGVAGTGYAYHGLFGFDGNSVVAEASHTTDRIEFEGISGDSATAGDFGGVIIDILDYAQSSKNKVTRGIVGHTATGGARIRITSGSLNDTTAVTSISLFVSQGGSFKTGSRFSLYGIKG